MIYNKIFVTALITKQQKISLVELVSHRLEGKKSKVKGPGGFGVW